MKSILRKAIWPGIVIAAMLTLLAAIGAANAPVVARRHRRPLPYPGGLRRRHLRRQRQRPRHPGPLPQLRRLRGRPRLPGPQPAARQGHTYLFVIVVEDAALSGASTVDVSGRRRRRRRRHRKLRRHSGNRMRPLSTCRAAASTTSISIDNLFVPGQWDSTRRLHRRPQRRLGRSHDNFRGYYNFDINRVHRPL